MTCGSVACHSGAAGAPGVTLVSNDGTNATYSVAANGTEWSVFSGPAHVAGGTNGSNNTFTVPVGPTYTIYDVLAAPGTASSGKTTVGDGGATTYTMVPSAGANGSISPATPQTVASGATVTFTITPDAAYTVSDVLVNGASVGAVVSYTFTNVTANGTISATFATDRLWNRQLRRGRLDAQRMRTMAQACRSIA